MKRHEIFKHYRCVKFIQLGLLGGITIASFFFLFTNDATRRTIYTNRSLFTLATILWGVLLFSFLWLLYDFTKMQFFIREERALNKAASLDRVTALPNRNSLDRFFQLNHSSHDMSTLGCVLMSISNLYEINDTLGHDRGDVALQRFSDLLETQAEDSIFVGRNGGNEFLALIEQCDNSAMERFLSSIREAVNSYNTAEQCPVHLDIEYTYTMNSELGATRFSDLVTHTYKKSRKG